MTKVSGYVAGVLIVIAVAFGTAYYNDHASCLRTDGTRTGLRIYFDSVAARAQHRSVVDHGVKRTLDLQAQMSALRAARRERALACSGLIAQR